MRNVLILGATGSIGCSTLDVLASYPKKYSVFALTAAQNWQKLFEQVTLFKPKYAVMTDSVAAKRLHEAVQEAGLLTEVLSGHQALCEIAAHPEVDIVMAAIVGAAGLLPTLAAVEQGKTILLANKEALVMSGELFINKVKQHGATLLPIDSEHNAIFQCLPAKLQQETTTQTLADYGISKLLLTGSGGPFLTKDLALFPEITPAQAIAHPNWVMGQKISVDSATMMNKGLEFIEAKWLFNCEPADIQVVIHPQSIIHSMVQYSDGSVLAQLGQPDMRTPIAHALAFPERIATNVKPLNFFELAEFSFKKPCKERYPCLYLAQHACALGQGATTALNAANEITVDAFLKHKIRFTDIARFNELALAKFATVRADNLEHIVQLDTEARAFVTQCINERH